MRKILFLLVALLATTALWAYDFKSGDLYYNITSNSEPYAVGVTYSNSENYYDNNYLNLISAIIPTTVQYNNTIYTVTSIEANAFHSCDITSISIPESVTTIGDEAFESCDIHSITIPGNVKNIGIGAFAGCYSLKSVEILEGVKSIGYRAFFSCYNLTSINIPKSVVHIGAEIIDTTPLVYDEHMQKKDVYIDDCLLQVGWNNGDYVVIRENTRLIADQAFLYNKSSLTSVVIPNSVTSIGEKAFFCCDKLKSITIPLSVSSIGKSAFAGCTELTSIVWNPTSCTGYFDEETVYPLFNGCNKVSSVVFGDQVTEIPMALCYNMSALSSIVIPKNVTSIERMAFYGCESLKSVYCYADTTPAVAESSFTNYDATLYVPCNQIERYKAHTTWTKFARIECITSEKVETEEVVVMPSINDAIIIWPASADAETYTIIVTAGSEIHSTLTFDAEGQLLGISYAPSRYAAIPARYAAETGTGFKFTLSGLEDGVEYVYEIIVKNAQDEEIESYVGTFTTQSDTSTDVDNLHSPILKTQKILRNGQLYILKDSKTYNAMGQEM